MVENPFQKKITDARTAMGWFLCVYSTDDVAAEAAEKATLGILVGLASESATKIKVEPHW
jgi:hypothetical protein